MEKPDTAARRYGRERLLTAALAAFLLVASAASGAGDTTGTGGSATGNGSGTEASGSRAPVILSVDPAVPRAGLPFSLTLLVDAEPDNVALEGPRLPDGLAMQAAERVPVTDLVGGKPWRGTRISFSIIAFRDGDYMIPPILVRTDRFERMTSSLAIRVGTPHDEVTVAPEARWRLPGEHPHAGETALLLLSVVGIPARGVGVPDGIDVPDGAFLERLPLPSGATMAGSPAVGPAGPDGAPGLPGEEDVAAFLFTAVKPGRYRIGRATLVAGRLTLYAAPADIDVSPLPAGPAESGAVGHLAVATRVSRRTVTVAETAEVTVTVSGSGSLLSLVMPEPALFRDGLPVSGNDAGVSVRDERQVTASRAGYDGSRWNVWLVSPRKPGHYTAVWKPWPAFDPGTGTVSWLDVPAVAFTVTLPASATGHGSAATTGNVPPAIGPKPGRGAPARVDDLPLIENFALVQALDPPARYRNPVWYVLLLLPLLVPAFLGIRRLVGGPSAPEGTAALAVFLVPVLALFVSAGPAVPPGPAASPAATTQSATAGSAGKGTAGETGTAAEMHPAAARTVPWSRLRPGFAGACASWTRGRYADAERELGNLILMRPDNPVLLYDRALCRYRLGSVPAALRDAERLSRFLVRPVALPAELPALEPLLLRSAGLRPTSIVRIFAYPDVFFWLTAILAMVLAAVSVLYARRKGGGLLIALILAAVLTGASAAGLGVAASVLERSYAVVVPGSSGTGDAAAGVEVRTIPDPAATGGFSVPAGTTVEVHERLDGFVFVVTPEGRNGWVTGRNVLVF